MLKFFLVGWVCLGTPNVDYQCVRMGSEVVHDSYESCNQYFQEVKKDLADTGVELKFTCVQAGLLEEVLQSKDDSVNTIVKIDQISIDCIATYIHEIFTFPVMSTAFLCAFQHSAFAK